MYAWLHFLQEEKFNGTRKIKKEYHESDGVRMPSREIVVSLGCITYLHLWYLII